MLKTLFIDRSFYADCVTGRVRFNSFSCHSLELPWRNNHQDISCIANGIYPCEKYYSETHGWCFKVMNVHNRTLVRGHKGNFVTSTLGCILFGDSIKDFNCDGILDVTNSSKTFDRLMTLLPDKFMLSIGQPNVIG